MTTTLATIPAQPGGAFAAGQTEYDLMASLLNDPAQWYDVVDLTPALFDNPTYRHIYAIIYDRKCQVAPAVLANQLEKSQLGRQALDDIGGINGIHRLYRDGQGAGDAGSLADEIRTMATSREIHRIQRTVLADHYSDPGEWGMALSARINEAVGKLAGPQHGTLAESADAAYDSWLWLQDNPGKILGVRSGLAGYDKALGGFQGGQLISIGGSSGEGKTQLKCYMAMKAAQLPNDITGDPNNVVYFSLEMEKVELTKRWLAHLSRVEFYKEHQDMTARQKMLAARDKIKALTNLMVCPPSQAASLDQIIRQLRWYKDHHKINIAFVDYAQLIRVPGSSDSSRYDQMAQVSQRIKLAAQELDVVIVMGLQLNRETIKPGSAGRPAVHHVADSMDLVRSSDVLSFIWDPARYLAGQDVGLWRDKAVILTGKVRHRGTIPDFIYGYEKHYSNFQQLDFKEEQALRGELPSLGRSERAAPKP